MTRFWSSLTWVCFFLSLVGYTLFSFALTAPNLTLLNWAPYTQFQAWMWSTLFNNRQLLTYVYVGVISVVWISYFGVMRQLRTSKTREKKSFAQLAGFWLVLILPLLVSVNALSYDVFNYIFNAKMVMVYHANPHVQVALDFATDPWVRFMHNTHTPAPYGYGWTAISLLPYVISGGKFLIAWLLFRAMSLVSVLLMALVLWWATRQNKSLSLIPVVGLFLNPLVIIEVVSTMHNDLWMMAPAVLALLLVGPNRRKTLLAVLASAALLTFSISIKLASLTLLPLWLLLITSQFKWKLPLFNSLWQKRAIVLQSWWPVIASILLFVPLLTSRAQQFHPWYLTWVLVWIPLFPQIKNKWLDTWRLFIVSLSVTSLFRYLPYFWQGTFTPEVLWQQKAITWVPAVLIAFIFCVTLKRKNPAN